MAEAPPNHLLVAPGLSIPLDLLRFRFVRASGPGGQNVNKVNSKAVLTVELEALAVWLDAGTLDRLQRIATNRINAGGQLLIQADGSRSQRANRETCEELLVELIRRARVRPRRRRATRPSRGARERRLESKRQRSQAKRRRRERFD